MPEHLINEGKYKEENPSKEFNGELLMEYTLLFQYNTS
jgi:hypothetical protein